MATQNPIRLVGGTGSPYTQNNQTGDPLFTSVTDGSEDFTPTTGSPLIGNGITGGMIGAVAHADGGGGSTEVRRPRAQYKGI